jgi:hypothetical protein
MDGALHADASPINCTVSIRSRLLGRAPVTRIVEKNWVAPTPEADWGTVRIVARGRESHDVICRGQYGASSFL